MEPGFLKGTSVSVWRAYLICCSRKKIQMAGWYLGEGGDACNTGREVLSYHQKPGKGRPRTVISDGGPGELPTGMEQRSAAGTRLREKQK